MHLERHSAFLMHTEQQTQGRQKHSHHN